MEKTQQILATNLRRLRNIFNFNQAEVAELLGVNTTTYQKYEYGKAYPRPDKISRLAEIFKVSPAELVSAEKTQTQIDRGDRASRILSLQSTLLAMSDDQFETVEAFVEGLETISKSASLKHSK